jgi:hypothetical protein
MKLDRRCRPQLAPLRAEVRHLYACGAGPAQIAKALGLTRSMVYTSLKVPALWESPCCLLERK